MLRKWIIYVNEIPFVLRFRDTDEAAVIGCKRKNEDALFDFMHNFNPEKDPYTYEVIRYRGVVKIPFKIPFLELMKILRRLTDIGNTVTRTDRLGRMLA